jgi:hypothetical protein
MNGNGGWYHHSMNQYYFTLIPEGQIEVGNNMVILTMKTNLVKGKECSVSGVIPFLECFIFSIK